MIKGSQTERFQTLKKVKHQTKAQVVQLFTKFIFMFFAIKVLFEESGSINEQAATIMFFVNSFLSNYKFLFVGRMSKLGKLKQ